MLNILGINISTQNKKQVLAQIQSFLKDKKPRYIVTPNPEIILEAGHNEEFFYIVNNADLAIPDGIGLKFAAWLMGKNIQRITGADLVKDILKIAQDQKLNIGILNWKNSLSSKEDIEKILKDKYPKLNFKIFELEKNKNFKLENCLKIKNWKLEIALVALGAPHQEKFIYHNFIDKKLNIDNCSLKIGIGIGGSLDFLTGTAKRAPKPMRLIGLEWLWRLILQPKRIKRIYNATIKFSFKFLTWRFILPQIYRPNVACLLYRKNKTTNSYEILLAERRDEKDHWQLPQGGTDGETLWQAGARELREEISCDKFKPVAVFKNLWKYKFGTQEKLFTQDKNKKIEKHLGYKGQKQGLFVAEFLGKDSDITINFWDHQGWKWVKEDDFVQATHECRRESAKIFLKKFQLIKNK